MTPTRPPLSVWSKWLPESITKFWFSNIWTLSECKPLLTAKWYHNQNTWSDQLWAYGWQTNCRPLSPSIQHYWGLSTRFVSGFHLNATMRPSVQCPDQSLIWLTSMLAPTQPLEKACPPNTSDSLFSIKVYKTKNCFDIQKQFPRNRRLRQCLQKGFPQSRGLQNNAFR